MEFSTISDWVPIVDFRLAGSEIPPIYLIEAAKKAPKTQRGAVEIRTFPNERAIGK